MQSFPRPVRVPNADEIARAVPLRKAAEALGLHPETVLRASRRGAFPPLYQITERRRVVLPWDWDEYLAGRREWGVAGGMQRVPQGD